LGSERLPTLSTICLFSLCLGVYLLYTRLSKQFYAAHLVVIVCAQAGDTVSYFKLLLNFRNVLKHTESRSSFACNQNIKEDISTALEVFLCFETKRNETKHKQILHKNIHATQE